MKPNPFVGLFKKAKASVEYLVFGVILEFTEDIVNRMTETETKKADLAKRLGTSPAYVTKILRGDANFTLKSMVQIAAALNAEVRIHLQPRGSITQWSDFCTSQPPASVNSEKIAAFEAATLILKTSLTNNLRRAANEDLALAA